MSNNVYGIYLGTNNFKVYSKATGKTMLEKNTIAVIDKNQIYAYGDRAYAMYEKAPETINVIFPVVEGVIADYNLLQTMIFDFLEHKTKARIKNAEFIIAVPTDITDVEKRAFYELFYKSKSKPKKVMLCEKPIADAVGLGIDVNEPTGVMIVDMGADTTETSVISLGGQVLSDLLHFGGNRLDESIISFNSFAVFCPITRLNSFRTKEIIDSSSLLPPKCRVHHRCADRYHRCREKSILRALL